MEGSEVVIAYDADAEKKNPRVRAARSQLAAALLERGATVGFIEWPIQEGKGIDDRLAKVGADKVLADIEVVEFGGWQTRLLRKDSGTLISCYDNVALFLENSPEWAGVLDYNEFTGGDFALRRAPAPITAAAGGELEDHFDTEAVRWLERRGLMVKPDLVRRVVDTIARCNSYHPVRDYLESFPAWDGKPRIGSWLIDSCGVESSECKSEPLCSGHRRKVSDLCCCTDNGPGLQSRPHPSARRRARHRQINCRSHSRWRMVHRSTRRNGGPRMLPSLGRSESAREKAFISQQTERFRLPYGHRLVQVPQQCVFVGTTNADTWLKDETGGRRFWPVRCRRINLEALKRDRDQLWAEALACYRGSAPWWIEDAGVIQKAIEEQRGRYFDDVWQDKVIQHAEGESALPAGKPRGSVSIAEILQRLGVETAKQDQAAANRVARCLKVADWKRAYVGPRGEREWRYRKVFQS
jgi:putative DNA primase/helicase